MKYYLHRDKGYYAAYFAEVGRPFEVGFLRYVFAKAAGYLATKAPDDMSIGEVHIKAQIEAGAHPTSFKVQKVKELYSGEVTA